MNKKGKLAWPVTAFVGLVPVFLTTYRDGAWYGYDDCGDDVGPLCLDDIELSTMQEYLNEMALAQQLASRCAK